MEFKVIAALLVGVAVGAASASAVKPVPVAANAANDPVWSAHHAAIPHDAQPRDPAPTF